jgi:hypothetical protein
VNKFLPNVLRRGRGESDGIDLVVDGGFFREPHFVPTYCHANATPLECLIMLI